MSVQLGNKTYASSKTLGSKNYKNSMHLGNKHYPKSSKDNTQIHTSIDGVIVNDSNSKDMQTEPMGMSKYNEKSYVKNIKHSSIEKPRKQKHYNSDANYY
jgi:hypothetical protein